MPLNGPRHLALAGRDSEANAPEPWPKRSGTKRRQQAASGLSSLSTTGVPRILFPPASASIPPRTLAAWPPKQTSAVTAEGSSGYAYTVDAHPAYTASHVDMGDDATRLIKWRDCHCLCRCCDSQGKRSNGDQSNHLFPPWGPN